MVKRRENDEYIFARRERTPSLENNSKGHNNKKQKSQRRRSAKDGERTIDNNQSNTQMAVSHNKQPDIKPDDNKPQDIQPTNNRQLKNKLPNNNQIDNKKSDGNKSDYKPKERKLGQMKQTVTSNNEIRHTTLQELQDFKNKLMTARINKELVKNMKESMLSLHVLMSGFNKQAAQVRQQQRNAYRIWDDLEANLVKMNSELCDEISHITKMDESSWGGHTDTPTILPLPHTIDSFSRKSSEVSRQNSLPSVFKNNDIPGEKESEIFTANRTNNIRKVAQRRTQERTTNAADIFPTVTQERGIPLLRITASGNDAKSKIPGLLGSKEARQRVAKRLVEMKAFQDKYIIEHNRSQTPANESNIEHGKQDQRKEINRKN